MYFLIPTLFAIFVSFLVVRAAAIALMLTGLDRKRAAFQALSAFTGTGFTTKEAESVIHHPMRRKIISLLMVLGNAGIVAVIITATSSFVTSQGYRLPLNLLLLAVGIMVIYRVATHKGFIRRWEGFIEDRLIKSQAFEEGAVEDLLHLLEGNGLVRVIVKKGSPLANATISGCAIGREGVVILGIEREKEWISVPEQGERIREGDRVVVYGPLEELKGHFR